DSDGATNAVDENVVVGTYVGLTAFASDADATTNSVSYAITGGTGSALFAVDAGTGAVTTAAAIDREALGASKTLQVTATSADGSTAAQTFTIAINDVNEVRVTTPVDSDGTTTAVDETVVVAANAGLTASAADAEATTHHTSDG